MEDDSAYVCMYVRGGIVRQIPETWMVFSGAAYCIAQSWFLRILGSFSDYLALHCISASACVLQDSLSSLCVYVHVVVRRSKFGAAYTDCQKWKREPSVSHGR